MHQLIRLATRQYLPDTTIVSNQNVVVCCFISLLGNFGRLENRADENTWKCIFNHALLGKLDNDFCGELRPGRVCESVCWKQHYSPVTLHLKLIAFVELKLSIHDGTDVWYNNMIQFQLIGCYKS